MTKLTKAQSAMVARLSAGHTHVRVYRGPAGRIALSRDAMYSPGLREYFWITRRKTKCG